MGSSARDTDADMLAQSPGLSLVVVLVSSVRAQQFDVSPEGGCLKCGDSCLSSVQESLPGCLAPALAAAGAWAGVPVPDLGLTGGVVTCVKDLFSASSNSASRPPSPLPPGTSSPGYLLLSVRRRKL